MLSMLNKYRWCNSKLCKEDQNPSLLPSQDNNNKRILYMEWVIVNILIQIYITHYMLLYNQAGTLVNAALFASDKRCTDEDTWSKPNTL